MKRVFSLLIGFVISAVFVYLAVRSLNWIEVAHWLKRANFWWIFPGIAVYFVGLWIRTWRWHYTLRHIKSVSLPRLFPLICIGYFGNNVYPFRAGEVIRSYALWRKEKIPVTSSLATVFIERIFDGLVMLLFVFLALPFAPLPEPYPTLVFTLTVLMLGATATFVWMAVQLTRIEQIYHWCGCADKFLPDRIRKRMDDLYTRFMEGLHSLSSSADVLMIFLTSIIIWLTETIKYWFVMWAFDFEVSFLALMLMNGIVNLATTLPSAPGYVGTFDEPGIETLVAYGVNENLAAGYTFTLHVALWIPVTLVGAYYFWREQLS